MTGAFRLIGAPFAAAFFSKEPILERMLSLPSCSFIDYSLILIGVFLTILYTARFLMSVVSYLSKVEIASIISEDDNLINKRVAILFIPSFIRGAIIANSYSVYVAKLILYPSV
jgi:NADH:ubiquinone oxidoreductase subunit 5 (subunit L)/multisubunit Na+/H+ antiporter MnhA subunit